MQDHAVGGGGGVLKTTSSPRTFCEAPGEEDNLTHYSEPLPKQS